MNAGEEAFSRRGFLIGAGLAVAGGAAALAFAETFRTNSAVSATTAPPSASASGSAYHRGSFRSAHVPGQEVGYVVTRPPGVPQDERLPVVFCLPGYGGTAEGQANTGLPYAVAKEILQHKAPPFGLAFVDGGKSFWHPRTTGEDRMAMLVDEFIPMVGERFSLGGQGRRGIMGWSMGGYGALLAAEEYPGLFVGVAAASPAVWPTYAALMRGPGNLAFDSASDFARYNLAAGIPELVKTSVLLDCGEQDPFYWYVRDLVGIFPPGQHPQVVFSQGGHDNSYWSTLYPAQIAFFARAFSGS